MSVYLETRLESIQERIADDGFRPLFSYVSSIQELYLERLPSYRMAKVTIKTDGLNKREVADRIIDIVKLL